ncbi:hypothetical protein HELRODRAFT_166683 [Helobdella robusta]|uniref:Uncharacterized protein n=1 Tax=Helobdella robusta TaxID=6412 RepID=T1EYC9_HELRO|nr:hypothetical protein HELRODRAFT_166683 [Helobdella robusta]ESO11668.1 hypothetical protein HELRODRAFT_166683 [Helobdella robusta]
MVAIFASRTNTSTADVTDDVAANEIKSFNFALTYVPAMYVLTQNDDDDDDDEDEDDEEGRDKNNNHNYCTNHNNHNNHNYCTNHNNHNNFNYNSNHDCGNIGLNVIVLPANFLH